MPATEGGADGRDHEDAHGPDASHGAREPREGDGSRGPSPAVPEARAPERRASEPGADEPHARGAGARAPGESTGPGDATGSRGPAAVPRLLLVTGAGGAGRTTVAAASAASAAGDGRRTLLLSGEEPAVLEAVLGTADGAVRAGGAAAVPGTGGRLYVARTGSAEHFRAAAVSLQERGRKVLELLGSDPLDEDELTELPGAEEFALLSAVRAAHAAGEWDAVVVDLPHTRVALRTLALPAELRRWLRRLLPAERQAARALRPALAQLVGVPMPADALYSGAARWDRELVGVQDVLDSPGTAVRLVAEPGPLAAEALRLGRAGLGLYGLPLEAVVANRVLPSGSRDAWAAALSGRQQTVLKAWREEYEAEDVPVCELPHLGREPRGAEDLLHLGGQAPAVVAGGVHAGSSEGTVEGTAEGVVEDLIAAEGLLVWRMALPAVRKAELELVRRGDELILGFGPYRRVLPLPPALRRCRVVGASLDRGELRVRCAPDPALWPRGTGG